MECRMVTDKEQQQRYLMTDNSALYFELRGAVVTADAWEQNESNGWLSADLTTSSQKVRARARIGPDAKRESSLSDDALVEWRARVADYMVRHLDDLNADILDAVVQLWLQRCSSPEQMTIVKADDLLRFRGLQPRGRSFWTEQRVKIADRMALLSSTWIDLQEMEVIVQDKKGRRKSKVQKIRSRAIVISSVAEETTEDGATVYAWRVRPGDVFAPFLLGPGKQMALLSEKVLEYDFIKYQWQKRIARYIFWLARIRQGKGDYLKPIRVFSVLEAIRKEVDSRYPSRFRSRFEAALSRLAADGIIRGWQYQDADESIAAKRGWHEAWSQWLLVIEMPQPVLDQYQKIGAAPEVGPVIDVTPKASDHSTLVAEMKMVRLERGLTQLKAAKQLGVNPNHFAQLERGVRRASDRLAEAILEWCKAPDDPEG
jgi:DNA-binding XRE family transcriptional regulator